MQCPRCAAATNGAAECPRCGVVLAKARPLSARPARAAERPPAPAEPPLHYVEVDPGDIDDERRPAWLSRPAVLLGIAAVLALGAAAWIARPPSSETRPAASDQTTPGSAAEGTTHPAAGPLAPPDLDSPPVLPQAPQRLDAGGADEALYTRLLETINRGFDLTDGDLQEAEALCSRVPSARDGLHNASIRAARQHRAARRWPESARLLEQARRLLPESEVAPREILSLLLEQHDWPAAERAARELLQRRARDAEVVQALAYALVRQDRTREARAVLEAYLETYRDSSVAAMLGRIRRDDDTEKALQQQELAHFHLRYDGEEHHEIGRQVLAILERHYAMLATTFDHQPREVIPVVLLSRTTYYTSAGVPAWAGGHFDFFDGRVRIPIGGLDPSSASRLESTVLHELTHAFVADLTGGLAPSELQEGLAQWMEGDRVDEEAMQQLMQGRLNPVNAHYLASLAFVEGLMADRGQGGINELLVEMGRTRSVDQGFERVYGQGFRELLAAARTRWQQQYGD